MALEASISECNNFLLSFNISIFTYYQHINKTYYNLVVGVPHRTGIIAGKFMG